MSTLAALHETIPTLTFSMAFTHVTHFISVSPPRIPTLPVTSSSKSSVTRDLWENLRTLYLFTKSDFKTILLPVTVFASIMAPLNHLERLPQVVFWIWLHLLQFCVSNQSISPEEDAVNKPWRPIPAGRVTVAQAQSLRWYLVISCLALSTYRGVLPASVLMCLSTVAYNDLGFHEHVLMRNICNALGYASFELGATQLAGDRSINPSAVVALLASAFIVFTTIHAADFRDEKGDRLEGKKTLPISFPKASRIVMFASLLLWSSALGLLWNLDALLASALLAMGAVVGARFMWHRDVAADRKSYLLYNIWLSLAHVCLGVGQYRGWVTTSYRHPMMSFP